MKGLPVEPLAFTSGVTEELLLSPKGFTIDGGKAKRRLDRRRTRVVLLGERVATIIDIASWSSPATKPNSLGYIRRQADLVDVGLLQRIEDFDDFLVIDVGRAAHDHARFGIAGFHLF